MWRVKRGRKALALLTEWTKCSAFMGRGRVEECDLQRKGSSDQPDARYSVQSCTFRGGPKLAVFWLFEALKKQRFFGSFLDPRKSGFFEILNFLIFFIFFKIFPDFLHEGASLSTRLIRANSTNERAHIGFEAFLKNPMMNILWFYGYLRKNSIFSKFLEKKIFFLFFCEISGFFGAFFGSIFRSLFWRKRLFLLYN